MKRLTSILATLTLITLAVMERPALAETPEEVFETKELTVISEDDEQALYREAALDLAYGDAPSTERGIVVVVIVGPIVVVIGGPKKPKPWTPKKPKPIIKDHKL